jgi:hypothetical protein
MSTFAIDYDGTWTADPGAFVAIASLLSLRGHRVIVVTSRIEGAADLARDCKPHVDRILFSSATYKRDYCTAAGEKVDVWIDDMPEMIAAGVPLLGASGFAEVTEQLRIERETTAKLTAQLRAAEAEINILEAEALGAWLDHVDSTEDPGKS